MVWFLWFRALVLKYIAFNNSKGYFIYFNILLYNTPNINDFIFFTTSFKYDFFINFDSSSTPNISLYNTPNINDFIFFTTSFKYDFFINFYSSSTHLSLSSYLSLSHMKILKNNQQAKTPTTSTAQHLHCHPQPTATFTAHHNFDF